MAAFVLRAARMPESRVAALLCDLVLRGWNAAQFPRAEGRADAAKLRHASDAIKHRLVDHYYVDRASGVLVWTATEARTWVAIQPAAAGYR